MKPSNKQAVIATPSVARVIPGASTGRISLNLVSIPPEKRMIQSASIPMNCVSSNESNDMKCQPKTIPTPRKRSRAGAPNLYASLPATTATNSNNAQTNKIFSVIFIFLSSFKWLCLMLQLSHGYSAIFSSLTGCHSRSRYSKAWVAV